MIDLYYWTTPNGHKITIFLEEAKLSYNIHPINISQQEQFAPSFLTISPNNKIPAIVDNEPADKNLPISIFESGAILLYLAEKSKKFISAELRLRTATLEWLFWQVAGLGPMAGQTHHFTQYASEKIPYAIDRYVKETTRLYTVLEKQLDNKEFIVGEYSIADIAIYPWILLYDKQQQDIGRFPNIKIWLKTIKSRPAVQRAYEVAQRISPNHRA